MKATLDDLHDLARFSARADSVTIRPSTLAALLAVVDAARAYADGESLDVLGAALEPFTPSDGDGDLNEQERQEAVAHEARTNARAWEEVDRWNAERDLAVKAAVDATKGNPRDRARDQLADAGVTVQRQFRSDQERIAELEAELVEARKEDWERDVVQSELRCVVDEARAYVELTRRSRHGVTHPAEWARLAQAVAAIDGSKPATSTGRQTL